MFELFIRYYEEERKLGGSIDITTNPDGSHTYGGSIDTPFGGVSGHVHTSPDGHITGGDGGISAGVGGLGSVGVHGSYDKGKGVSGGVHGSVGVPGAEVGGSVDVNSHGTVSVGGSATVGGSTLSGSVNSKGETDSSLTQSVPFGKRDGKSAEVLPKLCMFCVKEVNYSCQASTGSPKTFIKLMYSKLTLFIYLFL
ncbi:unnamed protein product [Mytilus coruscus]|uniref:Uncharacterized protein n=1 Tax=Mytilus coruscus TaxID=42192 RepID=A0A6J8BXS3_MYTCO|nr:unnamed protein product [Mytilus coruscus]